ncbi:MAG: hypothetical protein Q4G22_09925 [Paracoccus sp. (in: a-proteobacteria)]|uniref:hypothetical protein n=1 Tax=Paracoccus sp. TaxID=267 RepID=UPI0026DFE7A1|nr:hypothetical protein [Paracoccus sp. (in: a-proteobacteria)]MDO5632143.1 hypothetical protein [Paracoccus sp. (in: a-proteobacteria)]
MPAVGAAIAVVGSWATTAVVGKIATNLLISASLTAVQSALQRNAAKRQPQPGIQTEFTTSGGAQPMAFLVGRYATGGHMVCPPMSHGKSDRNPNAFLTYVISLGDVPGAALNKVIINDREVRFSDVPKDMPIGGPIPQGKSARWYQPDDNHGANQAAGWQCSTDHSSRFYVGRRRF